MKKHKLIAILGVTLLGLTACSNNATTPDNTPSKTPLPTDTAEPTEKPALKDGQWVLSNGMIATVDSKYAPNPITTEYVRGNISQSDNLYLEWTGESWVNVNVRDVPAEAATILDDYKETITTNDDYTLKGYYSNIAYLEDGVVQEKEAVAGGFHYVYIPKDPKGKYVFVDNIFNTENGDQEVLIDADKDGKPDFEKHAEPLQLTLDKAITMPENPTWTVSRVDYAKNPLLGASPLIYKFDDWKETYNESSPTSTTLTAKNGNVVTIYYGNDNAQETARIQKLSLGDQPVQAGAFFNLVETKDGFDTYAVSYITSALMDTNDTTEYSSLVMEYKVATGTSTDEVQSAIQDFYATPFDK